MRRIAVLAIAAACVAELVSGCAVRQAAAGRPQAGPRPSPTRVMVMTDRGAVAAVPWVSSAAPRYAPPTPVPPPPAAGHFAPCSAAHMTGKAGGTSAGTGNIWVTLVLTNTGTAPCTIDRGPTSAAGVQPDGSPLALGIGPLETGAFNLMNPPFSVRPGQSAEAILAGVDGSGFCADSHKYVYAAVVLGMEGTGAVSVTFLGRGTRWSAKSPPTLYACGSATPSVMGFGMPVQEPVPPPSPLNVLTVSPSMPAVLAPGSMATYTVTLANPTARAVRLSPCPAYTQFIWVSGLKPHFPGTYYYLNCAAAPRVPPHGAVTFAMRIQVPLASGTAKYGWQVPGTTLQTGGVITIR